MIALALMGLVVLAFGYCLYKVASIFFATARIMAKAPADYGRIKREDPNSPDAQITEAEYLHKIGMQRPFPWKYLVIAGLLCVVGLPVSCVVGTAADFGTRPKSYLSK